MTNKRKVPEIRFKGFDGEWEERHIGDVIEDYIEKTIIQNQYPVLTSSQKFGVVLQEHYFANRQVTTDKNIGYFVLPKGHFTYRSRSDTDLFVFNRNDIIDNGVISYFYPVFNVKDTDSDFFLRRINHGTKQQLAMAAEGTGQRVLSHTKFKKMALLFPLIEEQSQIGTFFQNHDYLITLHQRKYDKLTTVKKAMLEKMFPKDGADVPEIRFKGFTEKWEQRTLGEVIEISSAARVHKNEWTQAGVPFFRSSDVVAAYNGKTNSKAFISIELYQELIKLIGSVQRNDVLVTGGGSIGIPYLVESNEPLYFKDADLLWFKKSENISGRFLYTFLTTTVFRGYVQSITHIGTISHYTIEQAKSTPIKLPNLNEQNEIAAFFNNLDSLITLQQRELDKLKNIKKACLEKMFV